MLARPRGERPARAHRPPPRPSPPLCRGDQQQREPPRFVTPGASTRRSSTGFFVIRPVTQPGRRRSTSLGATDERSDRGVTLRELVARGYEDAHRQFIEPIVGASGDALSEPGEMLGSREPAAGDAAVTGARRARSRARRAILQCRHPSRPPPASSMPAKGSVPTPCPSRRRSTRPRRSCSRRPRTCAVSRPATATSTSTRATATRRSPTAEEKLAILEGRGRGAGLLVRHGGRVHDHPRPGLRRRRGASAPARSTATRWGS